MRNLITILTLCMGLHATGQTSEQQFISENWKKIRIGLFVGYNHNSSTGISENSLYSFMYEQGLNHSIGIQFLYQVTDFIEFSASAGYANKNFTINELARENNDERIYDYRLRYIELPLQARIYLINSRLDFYLSGGTNAALNIHGSESRTTKGSSSEFIETNATRLILGMKTGFGINYNLSYRYSLGFDVNYGQFFNPAMIDPTIETKGINIDAALLYRF